jgi:phosphoglycolate phosphatase
VSPPVRAVVFDLDGTLIDSVPDITVALNRCLVTRGRAELDEEGVARLVGGGARELVARAFGPDMPPAGIDSALSDFLTGYRAEPVALTRLYPGARELLDALRSAGLPLAICTNKPQDLTMLILGHLSLNGDFSVVWGGEPGKPLKPDAACLRSVCSALGVMPAEAIMVGDSLTDVDAARAAGCPVIAVAHGYERRPLDSLGADVVCAGLAETAVEISRRLARDQSRLRWPV